MTHQEEGCWKKTFWKVAKSYVFHKYHISRTPLPKNTPHHFHKLKGNPGETKGGRKNVASCLLIYFQAKEKGGKAIFRTVSRTVWPPESIALSRR